MKNKTSIQIVIAALIVSVLFLGATITGLVVQKVEYNDLCRDDTSCFGDEQCCLIYEDKDLGICMEQCQSFEFLCQSDAECEEGTVCCLPEGKEYGICNYEEKCLDVDVFAEYVGKMTFIEPGKAPVKQQPLAISSTNLIIGETIFIIALLAIILWLLFKKK